LELAERGLKDLRVRTAARKAMSELVPELKRMRLLTPETCEVLGKLEVLDSVAHKGRQKRPRENGK
jgi:hypothetical protein